MPKKKYKELSIDTATEIGFKNSDGETYKRRTLMEDKRRFFKKKSCRNKFKKSETLKISEEKYEELLKNYREKGLEKAIENYDIEKSQTSQKLSDLRRKVTEKKLNLKDLKEKIPKKYDKINELDEKIKTKEEEITEKEEKLQKVQNKINSFKESYFKSKNICETEKAKVTGLVETKKKLSNKINELEYKKEKINKEVERAQNEKEKFEDDHKLYTEESAKLADLKFKISRKKSQMKAISFLEMVKRSIFFLILPIVLISLVVFLANLKYNFVSIDQESVQSEYYGKIENEYGEDYVEKFDILGVGQKITIPKKTQTYKDINNLSSWFISDQEITGIIESIENRDGKSYIKLKGIKFYFKENENFQ